MVTPILKNLDAAYYANMPTTKPNLTPHSSQKSPFNEKSPFSHSRGALKDNNTRRSRVPILDVPQLLQEIIDDPNMRA